MALEESRLESLWRNDWMEVCICDDWYTMYRQKSDGIAVLVYDHLAKKILMRYEHCPPHVSGPGEMAPTSLTGMMDMTARYEEGMSEEEIARITAVQEVKEEAGIETSKDLLNYHGWVYTSKASDHKVHMFSLPYNHHQPLGEIIGDNTPGERGAYCKWVDKKDVINSTNSPIILAIITKLTNADSAW